VNFARTLVEKTSSLPKHTSEAAESELSFSDQTHKPKSRWWKEFFGGPKLRMAFVACVALVVVGGLALLTTWLRLRGESARLTAERAAVQQQKEVLDRQSTEQQARTEQLTAELKRQREQLAEDRRFFESRRQGEERGPALLGSIVSVFLTPGLSRSPGAGSELKIGPDTASAQLKLALERDDYRSYDVSIGVEDKIAFRKKGIRPRKTSSGPVLVISVPARRLPPGDYSAHVDGLTSSGQTESVADYSFRVLKNSK
jgi:type II secretory pathway pseudopilin PulG